ncbi:MAG: tRNA-dependent cyclodipeptide synthase [Gammaproteobacteria bacterium]|nr:tRNA-dependent cyclodipeptide synthase [Gammaproteobacteria bacterium]
MGKRIKAKFYKISQFKEKFQDASCVLPISLGQPYHEAEKMAATIELINKHFSSCTIIICDSLQRYTAMIYSEITESMAHKKLLNSGNEWLTRNKRAIENIQVKYDIKRWDYWYKSKSFLNHLDVIINLYKQDQVFQQKTDHCVEKFVNKNLSYYNENIFSKNYEKACDLCRQYLYEEAAVLLMWQEERYNFVAYPGNNNSVIEETYDKFISQATEDPLLVLLKLKFKKTGKSSD